MNFFEEIYGYACFFEVSLMSRVMPRSCFSVYYKAAAISWLAHSLAYRLQRATNNEPGSVD